MHLGDIKNIKLHKNNWKNLLKRLQPKGYLRVKGCLTDLFYFSNKFFIQNYSLLSGFRQLKILHIHYFSDQVEKSITLSKNIFISKTLLATFLLAESYHNVCLRHLKLPILCSLDRDYYVHRNIANLASWKYITSSVTANKWSNYTDCSISLKLTLKAVTSFDDFYAKFVQTSYLDWVFLFLNLNIKSWVRLIVYFASFYAFTIQHS